MRTALSWPDKRSACAACLRSLVSDCFCHSQHSAAPGSAQCSVVLSDWILGHYVPWIFPVIFFQPIDCLVSTLPCGKELHSTQILDGEVPPFVCGKPVSVMFLHWNISTVLQCLCLHKLRKEKKMLIILVRKIKWPIMNMSSVNHKSKLTIECLKTWCCNFSLFFKTFEQIFGGWQHLKVLRWKWHEKVWSKPFS